MANKDLFKQAIAEAKSIREAAIANAKEALEETLTPHLKDMLAAKLQEMEDSTVEEEVINEVEEEVDEAVETTEEGKKSDDDTMEETVEEGTEEEMEEGEEMDEAEDDSDESEDEAEEDEAEGEDAEEGDDQEVKDMDVEELKDLIRDIVAQEMGGHGEEEVEDHGDMDAGDEAGGDDETIDLDELLAELDELSEEETHEGEEMEEGVEEEVEEVVAEEEEVKEETNEELNEALETIESLRKELNEVNLLNSKLLYVNKIFKANNLSESQKVNIIAAFDKAETVKEVKLVFETVSENVVTKKETTIKESKLGMASKATGTTAAKPEVINEVSDAVLRMQKLAGIIK